MKISKNTNSFEYTMEMVGITKTFPGVLANDDVTFRVKPGEVHGLLGENGAGKSTLMNILYGLHQQDSGDIYINGRKIRITSPRVAVDHGIGMVHQHFMLIDNLTVLENIVLGIPPAHPPFLDLNSARTRFKKITEEYQIPINPSTPVWQLPVGDKQWLEILKQLFRQAKLLILDEPTAVFAPSQVEQFFIKLRQLTKEGCAIIFISHKLDEVLEITDRITVLRDGKLIGTVTTKQTNSTELAQMMVGREVSLDRRPRPPSGEKKEVLVADNLCCLDDRNVPALRNLNLTVYAGEIVGLAGVDGNGQKELAECIAGLRQPTGGTVSIQGEPITHVTRDTSLLGYIPQDRHTIGLIEPFTVEENLALKTFDTKPLTHRGILRWRSIKNKADELIDEYNVKTPSSRIPVRNLSGGNQQKVVIARELSGKPALLVASHTTRGLDLGAVEGVHNILLRERNQGTAILFVSAELSEVLSLSDRIAVIFNGEIMGILDAEDADINLIGELMLGHREAVLNTRQD